MNNLKYKKAWRFNEVEEDFIRTRVKGLTVNVCSGESLIGDIRIDQFTSQANVISDLSTLPIQSNKAETVICDPPFELQYQSRYKLLKELRRILKPGGTLIFKAPWSPKQPGVRVEEIWVPERQLVHTSNIALIFICRKIKSYMFEDVIV